MSWGGSRSRPRGRLKARPGARRQASLGAGRRDAGRAGPATKERPGALGGAATRRVRGLALGFTVLLAALGARLYHLQVVRHPEFTVQSASNYQRDEVLRALRGEIRTRDGVLLATNRLAVDLMYTGRRDPADPAQAIPAWDKIRYLAGVLPEDLVNGQPREPDFSKEAEVIVARNVPEAHLAALYEYTALVPSLELRERLERIYPQGKFAAHLLGYVQEATPADIEAGAVKGDLLGKVGLEYSLQTTLEGKNGLRRREVTAGGRPLTERTIDPGRKGQDVTLTIDSRLQRAAEAALREGIVDVNAGRDKWSKPHEPYTRGAIIAYDPRSGEVLALASTPTYDPNWFSRVPSPDRAARNWAVDQGRPLARLDSVTANRVFQAYNPGSVFKIASTLMYVERWGDFTIQCNPVYYFGRTPKRNWAPYPLGKVDARLAISYSCNPWYYHSSFLVGAEAYSRALVSRMKELGYGRDTGIEIVGAKPGVMRSVDDYRPPEDPWYPGFAPNMAIGQGSVQVTPAEVAWVMDTIINSGQQRPFTVLRAIGDRVQPRKAATSVVRGGNVDAFKLVQEGMAGTTSDFRYSTAKHELGADKFPVRTAGKTGTAENGLSARQGYAYTHAWYEGYGPIGKDGAPTFAVVAFFQNGGEGSGPALRAVKKMFAARWCVNLYKNVSALPLQEQQPCLGELERMREVYKVRAERGAAQKGSGE